MLTAARGLWLGMLVVASIVAAEPAPPADSITVKVVGTLQTGIAAIGGETTGTIIQSKGITWELSFIKAPELLASSQMLHGKKVEVAGSLERRPGVERKERWIITVTSLQPAQPAQP